MRLSPTLSFYIGRQLLIGIAVVFAVMVALTFTFDLVELLRRAATRDDISFRAILEMSLLKLPNLALKLIPFAALFGTMLTLARLTRSQELVAARAAGVSVWQFLAPGLVLAALIGVLDITLMNPIAAAMAGRYEQLEGKYYHGRTSLLAVSDTGLWLRQADATGQSVVHALRVSNQGRELYDVIIFLYRGTDRFIGRIDARDAKLDKGYWDLDGALLTGPNEPARYLPHYRIKTSLTLNQIQDSFASPDSLSFWQLPGFISTLEAAGFSGLRHRLHWETILATPLLLTAMMLIAATFSLRLTRQGGTGLLLAGGVATGFLLYFLSDVVVALGLAGTIPVVLAAWTPAGVCTLLGLATLLHLEDG